MARTSIYLSISLSVALLYCVKTVHARIMKSLLWTAARSLVFCDKILCPRVWGFPLNKGVKEGYPHKRHYFAIIA